MHRPQDLQALGDKENSAFFEEYLPKVYERRVASGLDELVARDGRRRHPGRARRRRSSYIAELAVMGPYRLIDCAPHRHPPRVPAALAARVPAPDRARAAERTATRTRSPGGTSCTRCRSTSRTPGTSARCTRPTSVGAVRDALEPQNIRFVYAGDQENGFYCLDHLTFTFLSDFTYNRVGLRRRRHRRPRRRSASASGSPCRPPSRPPSTPPPSCRRSTASAGWCWASTTWPRASSPASARTPSSSTSRWSRTTSGAPTTSPR